MGNEMQLVPRGTSQAPAAPLVAVFHVEHPDGE